MADLRLLLLVATFSLQAVAYIRANPAPSINHQATIYQQPFVRVVGSGYDPSTGVYVHDYGRDGIQALGDSLVITDSAYPLNPSSYQPQIDHLYPTISHSSHARHSGHDLTGHDHVGHAHGDHVDSGHGHHVDAGHSHHGAESHHVEHDRGEAVPEFRGHSHDDHPGPQQFFHQGSSNIPTQPSGFLRCNSEGLFRHPNDCTKFYRCVNGGDLFLQAVEFNCAPGLAFDEISSACTWPDNVYSCGNRFLANPSEPVPHLRLAPTAAPTLPPPRPAPTAAPTFPPQRPAPTAAPTLPPRDNGEEDPRCVQDGLVPAPKCSKRFYRCESLPNGDFRLHKYTCYDGMLFNPLIPGCIEVENFPECRTPGPGVTPPTPAPTARPQVRDSAVEPSQVITAKKVMKNCGPEFEGDKCTPFYKCQMDQSKRRGKTFRFECPLELVFNDQTQECAYPTEVEGCKAFIQGDRTAVGQKPTKQFESVPESQVVSFPCVKEGFFKDAKNCSRFIRCFYTSNATVALRAARFDCPRGLVFDEAAGSCNHAGLVPGCASAVDHSNEILTMNCEFDPVYQDLCTPFYRCFDDNRRPMRFSCPKDLVYDVSIQKCNYPNNVVECRTPPPPKHEATPAGRFCSEDGFIRSASNCSLFYRCTRLNNHTEDFSTHLFACPSGLAFDYTIDACNYDYLVSDCGGNIIPDTRKRAALSQEESAVHDAQRLPSVDRRQGSVDFNFDRRRVPLPASRPTRLPLPPADEIIVDRPLDSETTSSRRQTVSDGFSFRPGSAVTGPNSGNPPAVQARPTRPTPSQPAAQRPSTRPPSAGDISSTGFDFRPGTAVNPPNTRLPVQQPPPIRPSSRPTLPGPHQDKPTTGFGFRPGPISGATQMPEDNFLCPREGFFRDVDNCRVFHRCVRTDNPRRPLVAHMFKCEEGLVFDDLIQNCNFEDAVPECGTEVRPAPTRRPIVTDAPVTERAGLRGTTSRPIIPSKPTFVWRPGVITQPPVIQPAPVTQRPQTGGEVIREDLERTPAPSPPSTTRPQPIAERQPDVLVPLLPIDPVEKTTEIVVPETDVVFDTRSDPDTPKNAIEIPVSFKCNPEVFYKRSTRFCTPFYRCIRTVILDDGVKQREITDTYRYACPNGLVFSRDLRTCDYPSRVPDCDQENPSEELVAPSIGSKSTVECSQEGFFAEPGQCGKYYRCVHIAKRRFFAYEYECPRGFVFNRDIGNCDYPENVRGECRGRLSVFFPRCTRSEDLIPSTTDCNAFYRCWRHESEGTLRSVPLACPRELVLTVGGENGLGACSWPQKDDSCYREDRHKRTRRLSNTPGKI